MFRHPAWAVGSYSSGPPAANAVGTKSTGGFHQGDGSPCILRLDKTDNPGSAQLFIHLTLSLINVYVVLLVIICYAYRLFMIVD